MRPALQQVVACVQSGAWPTPLELGAMLFEADVDQGEASNLVRLYESSRPPDPPSACTTAIEMLRAFSLQR